MKELFQSPIFYLGLAAKIIAVAIISPGVVTEWYVPFLENSVAFGSLDPWSSWQENGGSRLAFPYGYAMWVTLLPIAFLCEMLGAPLEYGYALTLLLCDFTLLWVLNSIINGRQRLILFSYWLSPVVILATYVLGLNDVIPALYLMIAIAFLKRHQLIATGTFFALAISAKLSMLIVLPFLILFLFKNKPLRHLIYDFGIGFVLTLTVFGLPFVISNSGMDMLLGNPEMSEIMSLSFSVGKGETIYFLPIIFTTVLYFTWRVRRLNFDLFISISGVVFVLIVVLMPSASGWFVWTVPFLVFYQALSGRTSVVIVAMFSAFFVFSTLLKERIHLINGQSLDLSNVYTGFDYMEEMGFIIDTGIFAIGIVLIIRMWREAITDNEFFRKSREPFVIGIAGDSGAGKDTLADGICGLFGDHSIVGLSGDDYHLWDRHKPMWQVMTHLNPMANDLEGFSHDLATLTDGKPIQARHYNHSTGKMSGLVKIESNDFIIASGLHALYLPQLRDCYNLKIYLDIDEDLRRNFKIERDVGVRGHPLERVIASLEAREADSEKFIRSQKRFADLILSIQPLWVRRSGDSGLEVSKHLKLVATTSNGLSELNLNRVLVGLCGLHVDVTVSHDGSEVSLAIEGEATGEDVAMAAKVICPEIFEFTDISPKWSSGVLGVMQLIVLSHINQVLTKRFIK
jgi:uridine kinase